MDSSPVKAPFGSQCTFCAPTVTSSRPETASQTAAIVTAGGKNVAPQRIERILRTSHYIAQVVAYGDKQKYITALVTLEPDAIREWAAANGVASNDLEELARDPKVRALLEREVEERNKQLASFETVKRIHILARDFSIEAGELTPTLKIKRKVVVERYRKEIEALYS